MQTLLQTKLFRPRPTQNLVVRPRLVEALNRGLACKLTLISAPAGYGKTTLLSTWLNQVTRSVAWLSLDEEDNDPARFLDYIIAAMQSAAPGFGETIASLRGISSPVSVEAVLTRFINEITGFGEDFLLALDDYHVISDAGVHHAVMILLENLPPNLHIAIASRSDPPLRIPSLRVKGILSEIRARDLSFTQKEASEFFNAVRQMALNAGEIKTMLAKTEGWAAGLQLAAISLQNYPDRRDFMRAFAGDDRHVADYLFDEVLRNLSENIQTFLVETSILEQLCAELCMAVTGQENSQEVLEFLEGANLFLVPLDNRRQWYRYHHLFAELLQLQLKRSIPSRISDLHAQASSWYASQDIINQAIIHAIKAGDIERVEAYVKVNTFGMLEIGESTLINRWLD
jgi:LuxR family maltose regulon positive regulatory protein